MVESEFKEDRNQRIIEELGAYLEEEAHNDRFSGAVLVAKDFEPVFQFASGLANNETGSENLIDTRFNLGSINKLFTAVAIAQLVERGDLSFDDHVGNYLPDYPNQNVRKNVTIDELLTHTSGLGSFIDVEHRGQYLKARKELRSVEDVIALFKDREPPYPQGQFHYSADGYELLGAVIEKVSGQNYYDYIEEHIYKPAGMNNSGSFVVNQDTMPDNLAIGYTRRNPITNMDAESERSPNFDLNPVKGTASGSGYSTCTDLLRFSQALMEHKLLSQQMVDQLLKPRVDLGSKDNQHKFQGYGFQVWDINGVRRVGHPGRFAGVNARLDIYPNLDPDYTVVALSNLDPPSAFNAAEKATQLITENS